MEGGNAMEQLQERLALTMANFTAIPAGKPLSEEEMSQMVKPAVCLSVTQQHPTEKR